MITCLENLEISGILTAVREISGKKSCQEKVANNCLFLVAYLLPTAIVKLIFVAHILLVYSHTTDWTTVTLCVVQ